MASDPVVVHVQPDGDGWHVRVDDAPLLTLQSKVTAIAEAQVQAVLSQPSRVVIHGVDGVVEDEASYPQPAARPADESSG